MATASKLLTGCTYIAIFVFGPKHTLPTLFHYIHKVFHFIFSSEIQHILCLNCSSYCFKQTGDCNCITFFYSLNKHKTQCHFRCLSVLYLLLHSYIQSLILWIFSVTFCCLPSDKDPDIAFVWSQGQTHICLSSTFGAVSSNVLPFNFVTQSKRRCTVYESCSTAPLISCSVLHFHIAVCITVFQYLLLLHLLKS